MVSVKKRPPKHESIISYLLLFTLVIIAAMIILPQFNFSTVSQTAPESTGDFLDKISIPNFKPILPVSTYDADTLFEKIDGRAPLYTDSGFEKLSTLWFTSDSNDQLKFELYLYDMGDPANAFSVYSLQRRADASPLEPVAFAYESSNAIFFCLGKYYVEIIGSAESDELLKAESILADRLKENLPDEKYFKAEELDILAIANLVPGSEKFYTGAAFGCSDLTNIFTARYKIDGKTITVFLSKRAGTKEASDLQESYCKFIADNSGTEKNLSLPFGTGCAFDVYGSTEIVFTDGFFLAGVHEADDQEAAVKAAQILYNILNKKIDVK